LAEELELEDKGFQKPFVFGITEHINDFSWGDICSKEML
jgi:hypothetical protein